MSTRIKVYVVGPSIGYTRWLPNIVLVHNIEEADVVWFTGGADINPALYSEPAHPSSYYYDERDNREVAAYKSMTNRQLAIGTCRGAQLFCALNGGKLVQDVYGHCNGSHAIARVSNAFQTVDMPENCMVTSLHHQMMYPYELPSSDYDLLYISAPSRSPIYHGTGFCPEKIEMYGEPELVIFHKEGLPVSLGIQGHPEMMGSDEPFVLGLINLVHELLHRLNPEIF